MLQRCLEYRGDGAVSGRRHVTHGHINIDSNDDLTTASATKRAAYTRLSFCRYTKTWFSPWRQEMTEAIEYLPSRTDSGPRDVRFSYARPEQRWLNRSLIRIIERLSGQPRLERLYRDWAANPPPGENLFAAAIRLLEIEVDTMAGAWARVPKSGPVLFIANHPFGVIDGLLMGHLATLARPDTKIITHSLLCQFPEAHDYLLPIDFGKTPKAAQTSALTRRRSVEWLQQGHAVAMFPAGSVSTSQNPFHGPARDVAWHPFTTKLALLPGVTTVPVCFHGQNSRLFHVASHFHYALRIALLFRETLRRAGTRMTVSVGEPVTVAELAAIGRREAVVAELRRRTLSLQGVTAAAAEEAFRWPSHISFD
jgi:putative hemolysin